MEDHTEIVVGRPAKEKQLIHTSQTAAHETFCTRESPFSLCNVTDREREEEWDCACEESFNIAVSFHVGNINLRAFPKPLWPLETAPIILVHSVHYEEQ
jgi:hypothetical protein